MSVEDAIAAVRKNHGAESILRMDEKPIEDIQVIPSGNIKLDLALGVGGYPRGRIVEIYGPESSGKTTLTLHAVAEAQKLDEVCAFIDAEHALDPQYAQAIGVDITRTFVSQPDSGEQALGITLDLVNSGEFALIVIDSVAALTPRAEIAGEMGDSHVGLQARLMSQALRKLTGTAQKTGTTLIFINQLREKIGVMFGSPETTPGGRALKFYASQRLDIRRIGQMKEGNDVIGNETKVKVVKNKVAVPFAVCEFDIIYGEGMFQAGSLVDLGVEQGIIRKAGAWYTDWNGEQLGQGRMKAARGLQEDPSKMEELYEKIVNSLYGEEENEV